MAGATTVGDGVAAAPWAGHATDVTRAGDSADGRVEPPELDEPELPSRTAPRPSSTDRIAPDPEVGQDVGPFELTAVLGKGGAGTVFKARHRTTGRIVALKVLAAAKAKRARIVQRFFDEVRAAGLVDHPGLVEVYDFIEQEDPRRLAYAMEFVDGESLRRRLRREAALDLRVAVRIGAQICEALSALHDAGIIHRDLKPENILLVDTDEPLRVKLLDFGVVKFLPVDKTEQIESVATGTFVGTPRYMAPEQAAGAAVDHRADLFAVGVMLFEMITGNCPHKGDSLRDVVLAKLQGAPRLTVNPEQEVLPQELADVVDACLQLKPSFRPPSAAKVLSALFDAEGVLSAVGRPVRLDVTMEIEAPSESGDAAHGPQTHEPEAEPLDAPTSPLVETISPARRRHDSVIRLDGATNAERVLERGATGARTSVDRATESAALSGVAVGRSSESAAPSANAVGRASAERRAAATKAPRRRRWVTFLFVVLVAVTVALLAHHLTRRGSILVLPQPDAPNAQPKTADPEKP